MNLKWLQTSRKCVSEEQDMNKTREEMEGETRREEMEGETRQERRWRERQDKRGDGGKDKTIEEINRFGLPTNVFHGT